MEGDTTFYEDVKEVTKSSEVQLKKNDCYNCGKGKPDDTLKSKNSIAVKLGKKTVVGLVLVALALVLVLIAVLASTAYALAQISKLTAFSLMLESAQMNASLEAMMYKQEVRDLEFRLQDSINNTAEMVATLEDRSFTSYQQLNSSVSSVANLIVEMISTYPVPSCDNLPTFSPAGYYYLLSSNGSAVRQYCPSITTRCGQTGRWHSVANLDMTNSTHRCFSGLTQPSYTNTPLCVRSSNSSGCSSIQLPTTTDYRSVCGTVTAYQFGTPDAFHSSASIDSPYVEGVSITHGSPRQHIWTFAAAITETYGHSGCSCMGGSNNRPAFVGNDYFCDSGTSTNHEYVFYDDDPLWDGAGCGPTNNCCSFNTPPWFYKELLYTHDNIELRVCRDSTRNDEDIALETAIIYVK